MQKILVKQLLVWQEGRIKRIFFDLSLNIGVNEPLSRPPQTEMQTYYNYDQAFNSKKYNVPCLQSIDHIKVTLTILNYKIILPMEAKRSATASQQMIMFCLQNDSSSLCPRGNIPEGSLGINWQMAPQILTADEAIHSPLYTDMSSSIPWFSMYATLLSVPLKRQQNDSSTGVAIFLKLKYLLFILFLCQCTAF